MTPAIGDPNQPPEFIHAVKRGVFENSAAGTNVGKPVTASDPNGDAIAYSLSGTGSDLFTIDGNGQIAVGAGTDLDHETTPSYAVTVLQGIFRELFASREMRLVPTTRALWEAAASLRAATNLKTPDAIHAATALQEKCTLFVTNDPAFRAVSGLKVAVLKDLV